MERPLPEPASLVREELREPRLYYSILRALSDGLTRISEIAAHVHGPGGGGDLSSYLNTLQQLGFAEYQTPVVGKSVRRGIWTVADPSSIAVRQMLSRGVARIRCYRRSSRRCSTSPTGADRLQPIATRGVQRLVYRGTCGAPGPPCDRRHADHRIASRTRTKDITTAAGTAEMASATGSFCRRLLGDVVVVLKAALSAFLSAPCGSGHQKARLSAGS